MAKRGKRTGSRNVPKYRSPGGSGKINSTRKKVDGIQFRSLLEVFCYRALKEANITSDYEKHKYVLMEGFHYPNSSYEDNGKSGYRDKQKYKVRDITYTPDFVDPNGKWVIECKGFANERFPLKWKMFKDLLRQQDDPPVLFVPRNHAQCTQTVEAILELTAPTI
tara:strand:- start:2468 stop:2962 length:495 start_codon:yes stop_codon:yes gene_type:complete